MNYLKLRVAAGVTAFIGLYNVMKYEKKQNCDIFHIKRLSSR